jgi:hypothetical protein
MSQSISQLESQRAELLRQFLGLGDFRPGSVAAISRRCGKKSCHCAQPGGEGHPQFRLHRKVGGKSVAERLATPAAAQQAIGQVSEFHRFQELIKQLTSVNEQLCRLRPPQEAPAEWSAEEKKRLLESIKKSRGNSRRSSR